MGGKARIAKPLSQAMLPLCSGRSVYLEPFVGAGWTFALMAPHFPWRMAGDVQPDLIELWQAVATGWSAPSVLSRERYAELRLAAPSPDRAFAGFGCSFGGKWFGGYASNSRGDDFAGAAARGIERKRSAFIGAIICRQSYERWAVDPERTVIYCDPPYAGTTDYSGAAAWQAEPFWDWAQMMAESGALVFVSEYAAPDGWRSIWSKLVLGSLKATSNTTAVTEQLFMWGPG